MGTRIWYETKLLNGFNELRFVRMFYDQSAKLAIAYVADINHQLSEDLKSRVQIFLNNEGSAVLLHKVKHYSDLTVDNVPIRPEIPQEMRHIALFAELNQAGIKKSLSTAFPFLNMQLADFKDGILKIWISESNISEIEKQLITDYVQEIVPIGVGVELI